MKNFKRIFALTALMMAFVTQARAQASDVIEAEIIDGVFMSLPQGVSFEVESPIHDFKIVTFHLKGDKLCKAYFGNHPNFPSKRPSSAAKHLQIGAFDLSYIEDDTGIVEMLVTLEDVEWWPKNIHIALFENSESARDIVFHMVKSIRIDPGSRMGSCRHIVSISGSSSPARAPLEPIPAPSLPVGS
ncbi:hypothetical protein [Actomonas aquatica]|uniref:Uncharacterized protein n=1 Tax=Actomonas aquatica TaxID=2866162 RepID=A0ABZ1C349_9BACT|nr:hypothetical protein [Opitutus sp. WL0086]WRQ85969.1 hypothetical protein K1X11_014240 [Opitutus sp. WL0086]